MRYPCECEEKDVIRVEESPVGDWNLRWNQVERQAAGEVGGVPTMGGPCNNCVYQCFINVDLTRYEALKKSLAEDEGLY